MRLTVPEKVYNGTRTDTDIQAACDGYHNTGACQHNGVRVTRAIAKNHTTCWKDAIQWL